MTNPTDELDLDITRPFRIRWTRVDCERFEQDGLLVPGKYELIHGDILRHMGPNRPHINTVMAVIRWLFGVFGSEYVQGPGPIDVSPEDNPTSEPEPDATVLDTPLSQFQQANPVAQNVRLLVEVSEATRYFDRGTKADLYARAGIVEYWVLDLVSRQLHIHREPREGKYQRVVVHKADESVASLAAPEQAILVGALLPPESVEQ